MPPPVSVLTTIYNRETFLAEAIESVLAQTLSDFELILVDDASTDGSVAIAQGYLHDPRVRLFQNPRNLGDYPNRNVAAAHAQGRYLKYVDSDDTISPDCLATLVAAMDAHPAAALGLCHRPTGLPLLPRFLEPADAYRLNFFDRAIFGNAPLSTIIRRDAFEAIGGFSGQPYISDGDLWLRLAARHPVLLLPDGLTHWRAHGDQQFTEGWARGVYFQAEIAKNIRALEAPECPLNPEERARAKEAVRSDVARNILARLRRGHLSTALRWHRELRPQLRHYPLALRTMLKARRK